MLVGEGKDPQGRLAVFSRREHQQTHLGLAAAAEATQGTMFTSRGLGRVYGGLAIHRRADGQRAPFLENRTDVLVGDHNPRKAVACQRHHQAFILDGRSQIQEQAMLATGTVFHTHAGQGHVHAFGHAIQFRLQIDVQGRQTFADVGWAVHATSSNWVIRVSKRAMGRWASWVAPRQASAKAQTPHFMGSGERG
jgi:hypothetical protein